MFKILRRADQFELKSFIFILLILNMGDLVQLTVILLLSAVVICSDAQLSKKDMDTPVPEIIASYGYPVEKHRVKTEDGYIIQMHRIPAGRRTARRSETSGKGKRAVLLVHGLVGSSGDFVIMGPKNSLSFILADAGYDVWLGNLRGNVYTTHQNLTRNDPEFWDYSFHEHGKYDAPAMIDKVLNVTGLPKIFYIGYSMGTTTFFTMMSQQPEYNEKLIGFIALAPAVYLNNMKSVSNLFLKNMDITTTLRGRGMMAIGLKKDIMDFVADNLCSARNPEADVCMRILFSIVGEDYEQIDWDMIPIIISRAQPASLKQLEHYGKIAMTEVFTEWMDGIWGAVKPYQLSNVRIPVSLLYGENDQLTEKKGIQRLAKELKEIGVLHSIKAGCSWPKFNHLDFAFAKDVGDLVNRPLVRHLGEMYNKYYKL